MNLEGKNVFLSGGMSGYENYNAPAFADAHAIVRKLGARYVYNPAFMWLMQPLEEDATKTHAEYMRRCLNELTRVAYCQADGGYYDLLVSLPNWKESEGASTERTVAQSCGIQCVDLEELYLVDAYER